MDRVLIGYSTVVVVALFILVGVLVNFFFFGDDDFYWYLPFLGVLALGIFLSLIVVIGWLIGTLVTSLWEFLLKLAEKVIKK